MKNEVVDNDFWRTQLGVILYDVSQALRYIGESIINPNQETGEIVLSFLKRAVTHLEETIKANESHHR